MSIDNFRYEIHLTPRGWISGSSWFYDKLQEKKLVLRPDDAVETWERHETQSSRFSAPDIEWNRIWQKSGATLEEIRELHKQFPSNLRG